jgi:hypothetical protein
VQCAPRRCGECYVARLVRALQCAAECDRQARLQLPVKRR